MRFCHFASLGHIRVAESGVCCINFHIGWVCRIDVGRFIHVHVGFVAMNTIRLAALGLIVRTVLVRL